MKQRITSRHFWVALWLLLCSSIIKAQIHPDDSAQLINLHNATCNQGCTLNWDLADPSTWEGIVLNGDRVTEIHLDSMNLTGSIPPLNLPELRKLNLFENKLSGNIPNFDNLIALRELRLQRNELEGQLPSFEHQQNLTLMILNTNKLTGTIPNFDHLTSIRLISLAANQISGSLPNFDKINNPDLYWIDVSNNRMTGTIPDFNLPKLIDIDFAFNNFSGPVPSFDSTALNKINLGANRLTGPIPDFSGLKDLASIRMYGNKLTGPIPNFNLPNLTLLYLYGNELTDSIPDFNYLTNLESLYLQNNELTGSIPDFNLPSLKYLWLQGNELTDEIPDFVGSPQLGWIDLSSNELSGSIPDFLTLDNLGILSVKNNKFSFDEVQNAKDEHDDLVIFRYSPQFHGDVQSQLLNLGDSILLRLSEPLPGNNNDNVTYQWKQNGNTLTGSIDSIYIIDSLDLTQVGKYTLHMTDTSRVSDLEIISKPLYVYVEGYDLYGQPVVYNQMMVEFKSREEKNIHEENYLFEYAGFVADSCSCNRLLYLWQFPDAVNMLEVLLALNTKTEGQTGKAKVSGLNNKFKLSLSGPGKGWTWTGHYPDNYPDTVHIYMLDSGLDTTYIDTKQYLIPNAPVDSCHNNLSSYGYNYSDPLTSIINSAIDSMGHGSFGAYSMVEDLPENINIKIVPLKVFDDAGQGTLFNFICGLYHAIDHNANIINVSAGYSGEPSEILEDAIALAQENNIFIIAAVGNDTLKNIDNEPQYPAYYAGDFFREGEDGQSGKWIRFNNVKSVASLGPQDSLSFFTNFGPNHATLSAYGEDMGGYLNTGERVSQSGSSIATFYVTKQLAVEIAKNKNRDYKTIWKDFEISSLRDCPSTIDLTQTGKCLDIHLDVYGDFKVLLEGAYDSLTHKMNTTLNTELYLLPGQSDSALNHNMAVQPYNFAPFYYEGNEAVPYNLENYPPEIVDWILISARTDIGVETEVNRTAAWLRHDGKVQFLKPLLESTQTLHDSVYIVIEHRNHIGIMSPEKIPVLRNIITWDFTQQNSYTDAGQIELYPDAWAMWAGDGDQSSDINGYDINGNDKAIWAIYNGKFYLYLSADYNLDGDINGQDKIFWDRNNGQHSAVPR